MIVHDQMPHNAEGRKGKGKVIMFFHVNLIILVSKKIDCCTECRQKVFYHCLDCKATNMNKIFFKFAMF